MSRLLSALVLVALSFSTVACAAVDDATSSGKSSAKATPDLTVKSRVILQEFRDNEAAADAKYKGKTIQVNGFVDKIDTEVLDDKQYVIRVAPKSEFNVISVNCNDQTSAAVAKLKRGQAISVIGAFDDGGDLGIELKDCKAK